MKHISHLHPLQGVFVLSDITGAGLFPPISDILSCPGGSCCLSKTLRDEEKKAQHEKTLSRRGKTRTLSDTAIFSSLPKANVSLPGFAAWSQH